MNNPAIRQFWTLCNSWTHGINLESRPNKDWPKANKASAKGQSPLQELEVSSRSGLYLLVYYIGCLFVNCIASAFICKLVI